MKLFRDLLGPRNPTLDWVRNPARPLVLDLDTNSLSGVPLGGAFESLEFLGPATRSKHSQLWEFSSLGVAAEDEDGRIGSLFVVPLPDENFSLEPFTGGIVINGRPATISWISRVEDVIRTFGEPTSRDEDPEETILFYEVESRVEREIELTPESRIKTIAVHWYR
jgi:hypothetical protein